jgi:hypothetical protein
LALRPTPVITYNLTTALLRLGELVRASELLRSISADAHASADVKQAARARLADVQPRLAHLRVDAPGGRLLRSATVVIDGHPLDEARVGVSLPVDPAAHSIELRDGTRIIGTRQVLLREGERRTVRMDAELPVAGGQEETAGFHSGKAGDPGHQESGSLTAADAGSRKRTWLWVALGTVVVGAATAAIIASRGDPTPPGNVGTWTLGGK